MPRPILFDLDGTLLDTLQDIADAANWALTQLGMPTHPLPPYRHFVGEGADVLMQRILPPDRQDLAAECLRLYKLRYADHAFDATRPYPGIAGLLTALTARQVPLAVLSNKPDAATRQVIDHYFPGVPWAEVAGHKPDVPRKPDPAAALAIAARWKVAPALCLFVGDTKIDMATARNAGMTAVGCLWGFRDEQELRDAGAHHILANPAELLTLIK
jgi:phosphoglycolate phosphatase